MARVGVSGPELRVATGGNTLSKARAEAASDRPASEIRLKAKLEELPTLPMVVVKLIQLNPDSDSFFEEVLEGRRAGPAARGSSHLLCQLGNVQPRSADHRHSVRSVSTWRPANCGPRDHFGRHPRIRSDETR